MKENYKSSEKQRQITKDYYWSHREEILQKQRELNKHSNPKKHNTLEEFYESWNLYILERLQSPKKLPNWMRRMMILQVIHNNNRLNEMEQYEQSRQTKPKRR